MKKTFDAYREGLDALSFSPAEKSELAKGLVSAASPRRHPWAARAAAAAGIAVVLGAGAVTAYATGALGAAAEFLQDVFGMRDDQVEDVSHMAGVAGSSATDGGVTVSVSAVIGDDTFYAVVYTLEPEDPALFDGVERFEDGKVGLALGPEGSFFPLVSDSDSGGASAYFYDADPEDPALQLVQLCWAQTEGGLAGQTAHVTLHDLYGWGDEGRSAEPIAAGTWELDVPLEYEDTSVELASGLETTFNGCDVTIDRLTLSAIGVHVEYTLSGDPLEVSRQGWELNIPVVVTLKDGPSIDATWSGGSGETLEAGGTARMSKGMGFDRIIDVEDVASVRVGDLWIEPSA